MKVIAQLDSRVIKMKTQVRDLGVSIDLNLSFNTHINAITKLAFYLLKQIARIRGLMSRQGLEKLIHVFISSSVNYCNALMSGLPKKTVRKLQLIQNAAADVLTRTKTTKHITLVLKFFSLTSSYF